MFLFSGKSMICFSQQSFLLVDLRFEKQWIKKFLSEDFHDEKPERQ